MANYYSMCRTNYFSVTDRARFEEIMSNLSGEGDIAFHEHDTKNGKFMFYCDGNLTGYIVNPDDEDEYDRAYDNMLEALQEIIPTGEAMILTEIGNEKMRYLLGVAYIITNKKIESVCLHDIAIEKARKMLHNPNFETAMDY
jgi:hypothetical protein